MQQKDFDAFVRNFSQQSGRPEAAQAASRFRAAFDTPEGKQLAQQLMQQHGNALEQAAQQAQSGNLEQAKQTVQQLMRTPEGMRLAAQIAAMMGR